MEPSIHKNTIVTYISIPEIQIQTRVASRYKGRREDGMCIFCLCWVLGSQPPWTLEKTKVVYVVEHRGESM
jgi:hypothetical protein